MYLTFDSARLTGLAVFAVAGVTALSLGACSSSHDEKAPAASSPAAAAKGKPETSVRGLITSVSGNAAQVAAKGGSVTVDVSPSTKVIAFNVVQLTDVTAGDCVNAFPVSGAPHGADFTAKTVQLVPQADRDQCTQLKATPEKVTGTVASVQGNTINVTVADANGHPTLTPVTVSDITNYTKGSKETSQVIVEGKCLTARGTKDDGGRLQATFVSVGNAADAQDKCS